MSCHACGWQQVTALTAAPPWAADPHRQIVLRPVLMQLLVSRALKAGCLDAARVGFVAVHGTGTPLGDPIEVGALAGALAGAAPSKPPVLGSVKVQPCWAGQPCWHQLHPG